MINVLADGKNVNQISFTASGLKACNSKRKKNLRSLCPNTEEKKKAK